MYTIPRQCRSREHEAPMTRAWTARMLGRATAAMLVMQSAGGAAEKDPVPIGSLLSMSGALAEYGESIQRGVDLAVEQINAAGGVLDGRRVKVAIGDDLTSPQAGVAAAQQLISVHRVRASWVRLRAESPSR
jgi:ABC-type branched-subunit amino acid transport system substrate-binding protein